LRQINKKPEIFQHTDAGSVVCEALTVWRRWLARNGRWRLYGWTIIYRQLANGVLIDPDEGKQRHD
jgi:hypothetical protein